MTGWRCGARGVGDFVFGAVATIVLPIVWCVGLAGVWLLFQRLDFPPLGVVAMLAYIAVTGPAWSWFERRVL